MKVQFIIFLLLTISWSVTSQEDATKTPRSQDSYLHQKKSHLFNLSAGLITNPSQFSFDVLLGGSGSGDPTPAINVSYEYGLTKAIGVGAFLGYYRVDAQRDVSLLELLNTGILDDPICLVTCGISLPFGGGCDCRQPSAAERVNVITIAGKFSYHFRILNKLDSYSNVTLGYSFNRRKTIVDEALTLVAEQVSPETKIPTFVYYAGAGLRYFITPNIAAFGEFGYSNVHLIQVGASYRL